MQLELLSALPKGPARPVNILLVHGICLGAWVWEDSFLPFLSEAGFATYALSLRGHGRSPGRERIDHWQLRDFADDIAWAMHKIPGPTVIVGHSMGGGVAQYYLRQGRTAAGVVLLASAPPHGLTRASLAMYQRNPTLWEELYQAQGKPMSHVDLGILENGLFTKPSAAPERMAVLRRLGPPAVRASIDLMGWGAIAPFPWGVPPMLIAGGDRDQLIPPTDVFLTGAYYGVTPVIIPGCAHAMMLDEPWQQVAELVCNWLTARFDKSARAAR